MVSLKGRTSPRIAAAGISVAFSGVPVSMEECLTFFTQETMWRSFICAAVGAACVKVRAWLGYFCPFV